MAAIGIHSLAEPRNTSREHRKKLEGVEVNSERGQKNQNLTVARTAGVYVLVKSRVNPYLLPQ